MDIQFFKLTGLWGTAVVGISAAIYSLVFSKNKKMRSSVVCNITSFVLTSLTLHLILKYFYPDLLNLYKPKTKWLPMTGWYIFVYFFFTDYIFYLYHRLVHNIPLFWTGHYSHHSGDQLHLSLVIRDNILSHIFALPVWLLGVPLGLNPFGVFVFMRFTVFYQSFCHFYTERELGFLKYLLVTPYNHIIHHSIHFDGRGQNFGGILCIWDRLGGTYRSDVRFLEGFGMGLKHPDSLLDMNTLPAIELIKQCRETRSLGPLFKISYLSFDFKRFGTTILLYFISFVLLADLVFKTFKALFHK